MQVCVPNMNRMITRVLGQNGPFFKLNVENGLIFKLLFKMASLMPRKGLQRAGCPDGLAGADWTGCPDGLARAGWADCPGEFG